MGREIQRVAAPPFVISACFTRENRVRPQDAIDVYLDVSSPSALEENLAAALLARKPIVVGTTGFSDFSRLEKCAREIPIFYSANFSLKVAALQRAARLFARAFPEDPIDLTETHHTGKKDAPSGTALMLAKSLDPNSVSIQSIRKDGAVGEHVLVFESGDETLSLSHSAKKRSAFAKGALQAARLLCTKPPGLYGMDALFPGE